MKKRYVASASALLLAGAAVIPSGASAEVATKNLQAKYNNIKVLYNGYQVSTPIEPFIVDGTTYIPVRMMAGVFNKDISWDGVNYTINVTDRPDPALQAQLAAKDAEITRLKNQISSLEDEIEDLEDELDDKDSKDGDIKDLEDELHDEFIDYFSAFDFEDIIVKGDEDEVEITIELDGYDYLEDWEDLSKSKIEAFVEDIVEAVWDWKEFEDADVIGVVVDIDDDDYELIEFEGFAKNGDIELDGKVIN
ncbi:stalk domain-containing protein [Brevibacillus sp. TJ4]|uniref:stalk domain-containing protein n=1 Tax=Brevibacillus sp. TJ4 TaxID=3234853 RepID=UPI0037CE9749